jgi:hypothetical protein
MNRLMLGTLLVVGLVTATVAVAQQRGELAAPHAGPPASASGSELIVVPTPLGDKGQVLTVIDPRQRVLSVYHIDLLTGKITLKSVRNIQWDLQITSLNNEIPLPQEIQSSLEKR